MKNEAVNKLSTCCKAFLAPLWMLLIDAEKDNFYLSEHMNVTDTSLDYFQTFQVHKADYLLSGHTRR